MRRGKQLPDGERHVYSPIFREELICSPYLSAVFSVLGDEFTRKSFRRSAFRADAGDVAVEVVGAFHAETFGAAATAAKPNSQVCRVLAVML